MTEQWKIVVGIDGSDKDGKSLLWAGQAAARRDGTVHVVYAAKIPGATAKLSQKDLDELQTSVAEPAAQLIRNRFEGLQVTSEVVVGDPAVVLVDASEGADLLVMGGRGLGRIAGQFLGSVSQKVAAQASSPVVVAHEAPEDPDGDLVIGIDPDDPIADVVDLGFRLASKRGVNIRVVYAVSPVPSEIGYLRIRHMWADIQKERAGEIKGFIATWEEQYPDVKVTITEGHGHPADVLADAIPGAGLVVIGSRGHEGLAGRRLGSVAQRVLHVAPIAVIVPVHA